MYHHVGLERLGGLDHLAIRIGFRSVELVRGQTPEIHPSLGRAADDVATVGGKGHFFPAVLAEGPVSRQASDGFEVECIVEECTSESVPTRMYCPLLDIWSEVTLIGGGGWEISSSAGS